MNEAAPTPVLEAFPDRQYHPEHRLVTWHPRGLLDDALVDRILEFVECEERIADSPFDRYTEFNGLTEIRLKIGHAFEVAERRRALYDNEPVKSAFFCDRVVGYGIARLYEELMAGGPIEVRAFRTRGAAADWLEVPVDLLQPGESDDGAA